ncbi:MAG TPA: ATP-binding protein [Candidatus Limnocylindrales bacterium]|nr:ATP-binding protein [Candidatus Limnocylindrales bacterium]
MTIPADLERVVDLRATVRELGAGCQAPPDCIGDLVQAVDEAATNVIRHGYKGEPGAIDMTAELKGDDIVITLEDTAPPFDPTAAERPDLSIPPHKRTPGGMGIHLMRLATDSMEHRFRPGGGNILTLTRSRVRRPKEG